MLGRILLLVLLRGTTTDKEAPKFLLQELTTVDLNLYDKDPIADLSNVAGFGDAEHRGNLWYSFESTDDAYRSELEAEKEISSEESFSDSSDKKSSSESSDVSSQETKERKRATQTYRDCVPCPLDKLKSYKNRGIRWICGSYQRARRTFKSECMMRYRNCQDGTLFVKIYDHRCKNDSYHGRHWFYVYRT